MKRRTVLQINYGAMVLPGLLWLFLFSIVPMYGVVMAFQDFNPVKGFFRSPWVGLEHFRYLLILNDAPRVFRNTLIIAVSKMVLGLVIPLLFAILLNEVQNMHFKKMVQTIVYLPYFISWVILASIILNIFSFQGVVNTIGGWFGAQPKVWMTDPAFFRPLVIWSDIWKGFGYGAVIFLAALTGINQNLYEAAAIDGAGRVRSVFAVTLPGIMPTVVVVGVLSLGGILNAGFDQIYNLYNSLVMSTGDILDTWIYRIGLVNLEFSLASAAGMFKSVISFVLVVVSYVLAYRFANYKIL